MARIRVEVEEATQEGEHGGDVDSIEVTCTACGESVYVYGRSAQSIKRGCIMLREQCDQRNFYYYEES